MTSAGTISVDVQGRDVNLVALLTRLEARMRETDQQGIKLTQTMVGPFTAAQQRAANASISEAQALARAAVAVGDNARAHQILVGALQNSSAATTSTVAGLTASIGRLESGTSAAQQFGASFKSSLLGIVGPAAAATAAIGALRAAMGAAEEGFKLKASLDTSRQSIDVLLRGVRDSGEVWAGATRFAQQYKLTQQETTEAIQASVRIIRTSKSSIEDILGAFARLKILAPEKTFQDASRALSELQAGQVVSIEHLFNVPRREANEMKKEIEAGADAVTVLNRYLDKTGVTMDAVAAQATGATGKMRELAQAGEQFSLAIAGASGGPGFALLEARITALRAGTRLLSGDTQAMGQSLADAANQGSFAFQFLAAEFPALGAAIRDAARESAQLQARQADLAASTSLSTSAIVQQSPAMIAAAQASIYQSGAMIQQAQASVELANLTAQSTAAQLAQASSMELAGIQARAAAQAADQKSTADRVAAVDAQTHAVSENTLAQQAQIAAQALLNAGAAGASTAAILASSSSQVDVLTAAYYRLAAAQAAVGAAAAKQQGPGLSAASFAESQRFFNKNQRDAAKDAAAAQREQTLAVGSTAQKMALLNRELAEAKRQYGEGSAQAIRAQTAIDQAVEKSTKKAKGAGAARLSDQQKLNNSLLADQEKYQDQAEAATRAHEQRLLDIEREYQKRSLEQQRENEVSKRQSRADFYDSLTTATKDVGPQIAQELSAAYETAYAEAQKIAQAGNAKLAADYLALKQKQIQAELEYQKKLAEARKAKDAGEVERLEAIHKLQQQANDEEIKQLLVGGDANVNARNEAIEQEARNYQEQQGKIGTAADNAADRKINAALRAGKAVDDENAKLREQERLLNRVAGGPTPTGAAAPVPAAAPPTAPTVAAPAAPDLSALAGLLQSVVDALNARSGDIVGAVDRTTRAVGALGPRLSGA